MIPSPGSWQLFFFLMISLQRPIRMKVPFDEVHKCLFCESTFLASKKKEQHFLPTCVHFPSVGQEQQTESLLEHKTSRNPTPFERNRACSPQIGSRCKKKKKEIVDKHLKKKRINFVCRQRLVTHPFVEKKTNPLVCCLCGGLSWESLAYLLTRGCDYLFSFLFCYQ